MRILIIGADGQLGTDLCKVIPRQEQIPLTIKDIDITDKDKTFKVIEEKNPDIVINTAAYHHVDKCEDNPAPAYSVNAEGPKILAQACKSAGCALVHISTDYVFDGKKGSPYVETDRPNPLSVYGKSKLAGEEHVRNLLPEHYIIRTTGLYGVAGCLGKGGGNFVEGMLKRAKVQPELKVVTDEVLSPTYTLDLANNLYELIKTNNYGTYHIVNDGECSWYDFTLKIFEILGQHVSINRAKAIDFKLKAERPKYSALENAALKNIGLDLMRPWQAALKAYLKEKGQLKNR